MQASKVTDEEAGSAKRKARRQTVELSETNESKHGPGDRQQARGRIALTTRILKHHAI
jgi:hypothetical protein